MRRITLRGAGRAMAPARRRPITQWVARTAMALALGCGAVADAQAQARRAPPQRLRPEVRIDYLSSPDAIQAGVGAAARLGNYVRLAGIAGVGAHLRSGSDAISWRADAVARFQLDPFHERRWAPYAAAGLSLRGADDDLAEYLMIAAGLEGPLVGRWTPAFEAGLGGGARVGLIMRRGTPRSR